MPTYPITWDENGERLYETGVKKMVLYPLSSNGAYTPGVAWNGITSVQESPSGAEASPVYADDIKYLNLYSVEEYAATIEAYMCPREFYKCDGSASLIEGNNGITIGQQDRQMFGFCYRTAIGNDIVGDTYGYKLHLVYGCKASPSEQSHQTINDSPEAGSLSWSITTTPVNVTGHKPTSVLTIDSTAVDADALAALETILYGTGSTAPRLPLPDEVAEIFQ